MIDRKVIIVDMDGTISDASWRQNLIPSAGGSWEEFHSRCPEDKPTTIIEAVNILSEWFDIIISTARPEYARNDTLEWIFKNAKFGVKAIYMRGEHQYHMPSPDLKHFHLCEIKSRGHNVFMAIDDREDVCEMYRLNGVAAWQVFTESGDELKSKIPDIPKPPKPPKAKSSPEKTVPSMLRESARLFKERSVEYGDSYKQYGKLLFSLFPEGIKIDTEEDMARWGVFTMITAKIHRYSYNFSKGGHEDSLKDLSVYSAMLRELDNLNRRSCGL